MPDDLTCAGDCAGAQWVKQAELYIGSFQKTSIPPPQRKLQVNPPTPFGCPNTFTIIRNNFFSPPPPDGRFPPGGECGSFLERPIILLNANTYNKSTSL